MIKRQLFHITSASLIAGSVIFGSVAQAAKPDKPGKSGGGDGGDSNTCSYPAFSDIPKSKLRASEASFQDKYQLEIDRAKGFNVPPDFVQDTSNNENWFIENMKDIQHRVGNPGITAEGSFDCVQEGVDLCPAIGKRWSGWYNYGGLDSIINPTVVNDLSVVDSRLLSANGELILGGIYDTAPDPTRVNADWENVRLYTTWLSTLQRPNGMYGEAADGSVSFSPGADGFYLETDVDFQEMQTPGFRLSMWLMPVEGIEEEDADAIPSIAYDDSYKNGFEIDIFEYEPVDVIYDANDEADVCGNMIEFSWIRGFHSGRGKPPAGLNGKNHFEGLEEGYCSDGNCSITYGNPDRTQHMDINDEGPHTIGLLWTDSVLAWSFNGELVLEITDPAMISTREHYLIISREMTNGLTQSQSTKKTDGSFTYSSYLPAETGLYGFNGNSNIGSHLDRINEDKAIVNSINIWGDVNRNPLSN